MKLESRSLKEGARVPTEFAMGVPGAAGPVPGPNRSPHLAWSGAPEGTRSFAVVLVDVDAPARADDANKADRTIPYDFPRASFYHWLLVDIPGGTTELAEGADGAGLVPKGKAPGSVAHGVRGVNDYTSWFGADPAMGGTYGGYDGPWPPFNDERAHRYLFTVYALRVESVALPAGFRGPEAVAELEKHALAKATLTTTYALNPAAR